MSVYHFPVQRQQFRNGIFYDSVFMPAYPEAEEAKNAEVVFFSLTSEQNRPAAEEWRRHLSALSGVPFETMSVADLGYYVYEEANGEDFFRLLMENILTFVKGRLFVITDRPDLLSRLIDVFDDEIRMAVFTPFIRYHGDEIEASVPGFKKMIKTAKLKSLSLLGIQNYYLSYEDIHFLQRNHNVEYVRLAEITKNTDTIEPYLRHADVVAVLPEAVEPEAYNIPVGIASGDILKSVYLSALSPLNKQFWTGIQRKSLPLSALMLWHYLRGTYNKITDFPFIKRTKLKKITVQKNNLKKCYFFNPITGRYWVEEPEKSRSVEGLLPCTEDNYVFFKQNGEELKNNNHLF